MTALEDTTVMDALLMCYLGDEAAVLEDLYPSSPEYDPCPKCGAPSPAECPCYDPQDERESHARYQ